MMMMMAKQNPVLIVTLKMTNKFLKKYFNTIKA